MTPEQKEKVADIWRCLAAIGRCELQNECDCYLCHNCSDLVETAKRLCKELKASA